jgi:OmpA-OmpF porin, OOP family
VKGIKVILLLFVTGIISAQVDTATIRDADPKTLRKLGRSAMKQKDPTTAIAFLEAYHRKVNNDARTTFLLGKAYAEIRDYERAQKRFAAAYKTSPREAPEALYYYGMMLKSNGRYDSARVAFQQFGKEYKGSQKSLKKQARKEVAFCDSVKVLLKDKQKVNIARLDTTINKLNAEGSPLSLDDKTLVFSSLRTDKRTFVVEDDYSEVAKKKLYYARKLGGRWIFSGEFANLNDEEYNSSSLALSADRKRLYFTRCGRNLSGKVICALYVAEKKGEGWGDPVKLPKEINRRNSTSTMPAVATDPVKGNDVIYFVSDRSGGRGGLDIWYTVYDKKKGLFKKPRNAGSKINTGQDEITPYFDNETRTLYYSSDGLGGLGGFDIFKATGDGRRFTGAANLGPGFNTGADEIYYTISTRRDEGFFVSNRRGGAALPNSTCCDDIYQYRIPDYESVKLQGVVLDMIDATLPVPDANVDIYIKDKTSGDRFYVKSTKTNAEGTYTTSLEPDQDYFVVIRQKEMLGTTEEVTTKGVPKKSVINRTAKVVRKPKGSVKIANLTYDFNRADLSAEQKKAIDIELIDLLNANPEIIVEIQSHTDSKGTEQLNEKLSQRRADNIVNYVLSKGIDPMRIIGKGYGESQPVVPNTNPDGSDNPGNRALNRRTEFKIIGTIDTEEPDAKID